MFAAALVTGLAFLAPWLPRLFAQAQSERLQSLFRMPLSGLHIIYEIFLALYATTDGGWFPPLSIAGVAVLALACVFLWAMIKGSWGEWYLILTGLIPPTAIILYSCFSVRSLVRSPTFSLPNRPGSR